MTMRRLVGFFLLVSVGLAPFSAGAVDIREVISPGGIRAWLVHEPSVPVVSMEFSFQGGSALDDPSRKGTANMVSGLLDEGAGEYDSLTFQKRLEDLAVSMSFDAGRDTFSGSLKTLSENRDEAFRLLALALTKPRFDEKPVARIRRQITVGLMRKQKDPDSIAGRTWFEIAFHNHPYGLPNDGTMETVERIDIADLQKYVAEVFVREHLKIGVVGDITAEQLGPLLDRTFGALPAKAGFALPAGTLPEGAGQVKVVHQDIPQSRVIFGGIGIPRNDADWYAAYVLNYVLGGGGLTSRLNDEVREKRGLAYSVYSYLYPLDLAALHMGGVGTRNESVGEAIDVIRKELAKVRDQGITAEELADAKTYLNGSFPLSLTSSGRIASLLVAIQRHQLGVDYIDRRTALIDAVTLEDIRRVAKRLLQPENLLIVVVGNPVGLGGGG
jgi:zinc protease